MNNDEDAMSREPLALDGNGVAGALQDAFARDVTSWGCTCHSCASHNVLGAHRAFRSAGIVLRCPDCDTVAMVLARLPDRYVVRFPAGWRLEMPVAAAAT